MNATQGDDSISVAVDAGSNPGSELVVAEVHVKVNETDYYFDTNTYGDVRINALGGNDGVYVYGLRDHHLVVDLGSGDDTLNVVYGWDSTTFFPDPEPSTGIWTGTVISMVGDAGTDQLNVTDQEDIRTGNANIATDNYIVDSNTFTMPGTRISRGFRFAGDPTFYPQANIETNGVEHSTINDHTVGNRPMVVEANSLVGTSLTYVGNDTPTTVNVASFVGGNVVASGGAGNDTFNIGQMTNGATATVDGGGGSNTLNIIGGDAADTFTLLSNGVVLGSSVSGYSNIQLLSVDGAGGNDTLTFSNALPIALSLKGGAGDDTISLSPALTNLAVDGGAGSNTLVLAYQNMSAPVNYTFQTNGLQLSGALSLFFTATNTATFKVFAGLADDTFLFATTYPYTVEAHGGGGSDTFTVGGGNLAAASHNFTLTGDAGGDTLQFDDRFSSTNLPWTVAAATIGLGTNLFAFSDFENVNIFGNATGSTFDISGSPPIGIQIDAGGGSDTITLTNTDNLTDTILRPLYLTGGGGTADALVIDDRTAPDTNYDVFNDAISSGIATGAARKFIQFQLFASITLSTNDAANIVRVFGTPSSITQQMTLRLGGGDDTVTIAGHGATGQSSFDGTLGIFGQAGTDTVTVNDTSNASGATFTVSNFSGSGTANVLGIGAGALGVFTDVEALALNCGSGADTLKMESYQTTTAFSFAGGAGADTVQVEPTAHDLATGFTYPGPFSFDGGPDADVFQLFNQANTSAWNYTRTGNTLVATRSGTTAFARTFTFANYEETDITAGNAADTFSLNNAAAGSVNFFTGGGGADTSVIGGPLDNILGTVGIFGDAADSLVVDDSADTTGDVLHLDQNTLGNAYGDTLFGPGGHLYFSGVGVLTLNLGSGADTIDAQLNAATALHLNAGAPSGSTGDALHLATAGTTGYALTPTGTGAGTVTASNRKTLTFSGVDQTVQADAVAPAATGGSYLFDAPKPAIDVAFSEDVSSQLRVFAFELDNVTPGHEATIGFDVMQLAFNSATNHATLTFPGLPNGILPDGNYQLVLSAQSFSDAFGNYSALDYQLNFFVLGGDVDHNGTVGFSDLLAMARNYGQSGRSFSAGNFDYSSDGKVGFDDLLILARNYGKTLPVPASIAPMTSQQLNFATSTRRRRADEDVLS